MTIRPASFTHAFFRHDSTPQATNNDPGPGTARQSAPVYFTGGDDIGKFREFMANRPLFEQCKSEYRALLDRLRSFAEHAGPQLSPPLTADTLTLIRENIHRLQLTIANPPDQPPPGMPQMYGLGKERIQDLVELLEARSSSLHRESRQRHLARRMDILQTLAPHLGACSGGVITALEDALASLRPQNMGTAGKARLGLSRYLRNVALEKVRSVRGLPGNEVHRTNALYNRFAPGRGVPPVADRYADWPANQPTSQDIADCERRIDAHLKPARLLRPVADEYLDIVRGAVTDGTQAGDEADDIYMQLHLLTQGQLRDAFGPVSPYSVLVSQSDTQDPYIAHYPDLLAAEFTKNLETQGLVETGRQVSLGRTGEIDFTSGTGSAGRNKRRRLENKGTGEIMQWAGLYWMRKGKHDTELSPGRLLDLQPRDMLRDLAGQGISAAEQTAIFQDLAEHVFASRERENITAVSSDWINDLTQVAEQSPAGTRDGLLHAVVMLACTFNHPEALRRLHQLRPGSGQAMHGREGQYLNEPAPTGELPMTAAAINGHHAIVAFLAAHGANPNIRDAQGVTPVVHAVRHGRAAALQALITAGADVGEVGLNNAPLVLLAAAKNHAPLVAILMDASPAARSVPRRLGVLIYAVRQQSDALMEVLKARGTSLDMRNEHGMTPLWTAIGENNPGAARFLLRHGADRELQDKDGNTALLMSAGLPGADIASLLIESHANLDHLNGRQWSALMIAASRGNHLALEALISAKAAATPPAFQTYLDQQGNRGQTALMLAAAANEPRSLAVLIRARANLDLCDHAGRHALAYAASFARENAINVLLETKAAEGGPALRAYVNHKSRNGATALMTAAEKGHSQIVRLLLDAHANLDSEDNERMTALSYAARSNAETVRVLLEAKAAEGSDALARYVNHQNQYGETALMMAAAQGTPDIILALIESDADVDAWDGDNHTALAHAAAQGKTDNVRALIDAGADLELWNVNHETALFKAFQGDHLETAGVLLDAGAEAMLTDSLGNTALLHAARLGSVRLVREFMALYEGLAQEDLINHQNDRGMNALMEACAGAHADVVTLLIRLGSILQQAGKPQGAVDIEARDILGMNALMHASAGGSHVAVNTLIAEGAEIDGRDEEGATALLHAARHGHPMVIHALTTSGRDDATASADVNLATVEGQSALMAAALAGHFHAVTALLVQPGIHVDARDTHGRNALMYAASKEPADQDIVISLLGRTPDIHAADIHGMDVFQLAVRSKSFLTLKRLVAAGFDPTRATTETGRHAAMVVAEETGYQTIIDYLRHELRLS